MRWNVAITWEELENILNHPYSSEVRLKANKTRHKGKVLCMASPPLPFAYCRPALFCPFLRNFASLSSIGGVCVCVCVDSYCS